MFFCKFFCDSIITIDIFQFHPNIQTNQSMVSWTINCRTGYDSSRGLGPGLDNCVVLTCRAKNILFFTLFNFFNFSKKMYNFFIGIAIFMCQFHGAKFIPGRYFTPFCVNHSESLSKCFHTLNLLPKKLCTVLHKVGMMASLIGWLLTIPEIRSCLV